MSRVLVYYLCVALAAFGGTLIVAILVPSTLPGSWTWLIRASTVMVLVLAVTQAFLKRSDLRWSDFGVATRRWHRGVARGALGGLLLSAAWLAVLSVLSPFALEWNPGWMPARFVAASLGTLAMGIAEEVGYRSYGLVESDRRAGPVVAVALSSAIFVAAHIAGGVPWVAALLVVGSATVLFCVVMLETRQLALVIALHVVTNLVQDNTLRGAPDASLFTAHATSPAGSEWASWGAIALLNLGAAAAVVAWHRRRRAKS